LENLHTGIAEIDFKSAIFAYHEPGADFLHLGDLCGDDLGSVIVSRLEIEECPFTVFYWFF